MHQQVVPALQAIPPGPGGLQILDGTHQHHAVRPGPQADGDEVVISLLPVRHPDPCTQQPLPDHHHEGPVLTLDVVPNGVLRRKFVDVDPGPLGPHPVPQTSQELRPATAAQGQGAVSTIEAWLAVTPPSHAGTPAVTVVDTWCSVCIPVLCAVSSMAEAVLLAHGVHVLWRGTAVVACVTPSAVTPSKLFIASSCLKARFITTSG
mmetsp:Transcript_13812/g.29804  ORF Transcript_13812/g.29804 Transcript_13812/m.29804 type:complete len:206 (-) Transcript_13812:239-856(-)